MQRLYSQSDRGPVESAVLDFGIRSNNLGVQVSAYDYKVDLQATHHGGQPKRQDFVAVLELA
jgi:hypothetical protein